MEKILTIYVHFHQIICNYTPLGLYKMAWQELSCPIGFLDLLKKLKGALMVFSVKIRHKVYTKGNKTMKNILTKINDSPYNSVP